jgi:hypothetical protein
MMILFIIIFTLEKIISSTNFIFCIVQNIIHNIRLFTLEKIISSTNIKNLLIKLFTREFIIHIFLYLIILFIIIS